MEFAILFILSLLLIIYNNYIRKEYDEFSETKPTQVVTQPKPVKKTEKLIPQKPVELKQDNKPIPQPVKEPKIKRKLRIEEIPKVSKAKDALLNSFRDGKDLKNVHIFNEGRLILSSDEKKIYVFLLDNLMQKNPKSYTKNIDSDVINDLYMCESSKLIAVALKNSKQIIFYELFYNSSDNKTKLQKVEKKAIKSDHTFEINHVVYSKDGNYIATTGVNNDTTVNIYNAHNLNKIEAVDINELQNIHISFSPDDKYLTISTYMYEISVIEFKKSSKFNKNNNSEEVTTKVQKNRSIGGIKVPILSYEFSNEHNYFVVSSMDNKIKVFQSFAPNYNLEESKCIREIDIDFDDESFLPSAENISMYVLETKQNDFEAVIACSHNQNLYIFNSQGNIIRYIPKAHDSDIIKLKVVKDMDSSNSKELYVLSVSKDGRFNFYRIFN